MTRQFAPEWVSSSVDDDPGVTHCFWMPWCRWLGFNLTGGGS